MAILKFLHKHAPGEVMVLIQNFLFHRFISQLLLKFRFLKFNMFNRYKHNISKLVLVFSNFKILDLK